MTEKDWSRLLTEEYITMEHNMENECMEMRKCKAELDSTDTDWPISWSICRQPADILPMESNVEYFTDTRTATQDEDI